MRKPNVLFLCTGNSARSQIAEALLRKQAGQHFNVYSAGTAPQAVHKLAIEVLKEYGASTAELRSKGIEEFLNRVPIDYLIVVCSGANKSCPRVWPGKCQRFFWPFDDPAAATGTDAQRLAAFREIREQIDDKISEWLAGLTRTD